MVSREIPGNSGPDGTSPAAAAGSAATTWPWPSFQRARSDDAPSSSGDTHEPIYQALSVQPPDELRKNLYPHLSTTRPMRRPHDGTMRHECLSRGVHDQSARFTTLLHLSARHEKIQPALSMPIYVCDPHSPWQRGTNKNTNRLLRHWLTKGTDPARFNAGDLNRIAASLNARP